TSTDRLGYPSDGTAPTLEIDQYDSDGRLWLTNKAGVITGYEYDMVDNVTAEIKLPNPLPVITPLNDPSKLAALTSSGIETDYVRDAMGRVVETRQPSFSASSNTTASGNTTADFQVVSSAIQLGALSAVYDPQPDDYGNQYTHFSISSFSYAPLNAYGGQ